MMFERNVVNHCLRIVSALALTVAMVTSSILVPNPPGGSSRPDHAHHTFASPVKQSARLNAGSLPSRAGLLKAVPCENEEEVLSEMAHPARGVLDVSPLQGRVISGHLATTGAVQLLHPLRC